MAAKKTYDTEYKVQKTYDTEYKVQAVKLGREIGFSKAARELNVNADREVW